eukprot:c17390_g1_i1 orf=94-279(-)
MPVDVSSVRIPEPWNVFLDSMLEIWNACHQAYYWKVLSLIVSPYASPLSNLFLRSIFTLSN